MGPMPYTNLIPWRAQESKRKMRRMVLMLLFSLVLTGLISFGANIWLNQKVRANTVKRQELIHIQSAKTANSKRLSELHIDLNESNLSKKLLNTAGTILDHKPNDIHIQSLKYQNPKMILEGTSGEQHLNKWVLHIQQLPIVRNTELVDAQLQGATLKWILHLTLLPENSYSF